MLNPANRDYLKFYVMLYYIFSDRSSVTLMTYRIEFVLRIKQNLTSKIFSCNDTE